jgi:hypothetical protein
MTRPLHDAAGRACWGVACSDPGVFRPKLGGILLDLNPEEFHRLVRLVDTAALHVGLGSEAGRRPDADPPNGPPVACNVDTRWRRGGEDTSASLLLHGT